MRNRYRLSIPRGGILDKRMLNTSRFPDLNTSYEVSVRCTRATTYHHSLLESIRPPGCAFLPSIELSLGSKLRQPLEGVLDLLHISHDALPSKGNYKATGAEGHHTQHDDPGPAIAFSCSLSYLPLERESLSRFLDRSSLPLDPVDRTRASDQRRFHSAERSNTQNRSRDSW